MTCSRAQQEGNPDLPPLSPTYRTFSSPKMKEIQHLKQSRKEHCGHRTMYHRRSSKKDATSHPQAGSRRHHERGTTTTKKAKGRWLWETRRYSCLVTTHKKVSPRKARQRPGPAEQQIQAHWLDDMWEMGPGLQNLGDPEMSTQNDQMDLHFIHSGMKTFQRVLR